MQDFCFSLPKIEVHAHLNGSISLETLKEILEKKKSNGETFESKNIDVLTTGNNFPEVFEMFSLVYSLVNDIPSVRYATRYVIRDFAKENVKYLELRTTPRAKEISGMDKLEYITNILDEIDICKNEIPTIFVRLILSIDRRTNLEDALDTVYLANKLKHRGIVGVDLCGDPTKGNYKAIEPAFFKARELGLKITFHVGEVINYEESKEMISFIPDRIGHATYLNSELKNMVLQSKIPLELCPTSNFKCQTVKNHDEHHFKEWYFQNHPVLISTDDRGVFDCSLSGEYLIMANSFSLTKKNLFDLSYQTIDSIFSDDEMKQQLRQMWKDEKLLLLQN